MLCLKRSCRSVVVVSGSSHKQASPGMWPCRWLRVSGFWWTESRASSAGAGCSRVLSLAARPRGTPDGLCPWKFLYLIRSLYLNLPRALWFFCKKKEKGLFLGIPKDSAEADLLPARNSARQATYRNQGTVQPRQALGSLSERLDKMLNSEGVRQRSRN